jgi:hypothetical protein
VGCKRCPPTHQTPHNILPRPPRGRFNGSYQGNPGTRAQHKMVHRTACCPQTTCKYTHKAADVTTRLLYGSQTSQLKQGNGQQVLRLGSKP